VIVLALVWNFAAEGRAERAGTQDWYALLGVDPRAGDDELRRAFRALSRVYHPDRLGPNAPREAEDRFILIRLAYETLSDPIKRFAYDR
jgi:curved DNA-binding protein CbpA